MARRAIIRTEAFVLRTMKYSETSLIVTLFTREKGKITVIAKGARRTKSAFGASLQPMSYTQVVFYYKPTRSLQTLSESALVEPHLALSRSLEKITIGLRIVELLRALLEEEAPQPAVFNLTRDVLRRLDAADARAGNVWPYFQLRLAAALGVAPSVERAAVQALSDDGGWLDLESGAVQPSGGTVPTTARRTTRPALRAYAVYARAHLDDVMRMRLAPALRRTVEQLVDDYMQYQFESAYPSTCRRVVSQLLDREISMPRPPEPRTP